MSLMKDDSFDPLGGQSPDECDVMEDYGPPAPSAPRKRYELKDLGFKEVPKKYRRFYRKWQGAGDTLAPNEVLCPVCKVVIRSSRELREGDKVYCMPCMTRLVCRRDARGMLVGESRH